MQPIEEALRSQRARYVEANPKSHAQHQMARMVMPGGNTRSAVYHDPFPLTIVRGSGAYIWDHDGHKYADFLGDFTSGLYGHSEVRIREAIIGAFSDGVSLGGPTLLEFRLASEIVRRFPSIDLVRFTNSGTEANLLAITTAHAFTGRKIILVFEGGYHGGLLRFSGRPELNAPFEFVVARYKDLNDARRLIELHRENLAAILVEPMQGAAGSIPAHPDFLVGLRELADDSGTLLIFDEVMTARLSDAGAQGFFDVFPDMTTLGKFCGGGLPFGAFGGRSEIMEIFDTSRKDCVFHSGTFNNNVLSMAAGAAGLADVLDSDTLRHMNDRGDRLRTSLNALCAEHGVAMQFTGLGSLLSMHPRSGDIASVRDVAACDARVRELFWYHMLENSIFTAKRGSIALMLPISEDDCETFIGAVRAFIDTYGTRGVLGSAE